MQQGLNKNSQKFTWVLFLIFFLHACYTCTYTCNTNWPFFISFTGACKQSVKRQRALTSWLTVIFLWQVNLAQCVVYLARAPKDVEVYQAYNKAKHSVNNHKGALPSVPLHLRNASNKVLKSLGTVYMKWTNFEWFFYLSFFFFLSA